MPFNGSGQFLRTQNWQADAAAGIKIVADRHDNEDDNLASGLSSVICRDGQSQITQDIPWNGKKITGLANPVNPQDAATKAYADAIRNFSTGITIGANGVTLAGLSTGVAPNQVSTAVLGYVEADMSLVGRNAGSPAGSTKRLAFNDAVNGAGADVLWVNEDGSTQTPGAVQPRGTMIERWITASDPTFNCKPAGLRFLEIEGVGPGGGGGGAFATTATQWSAGGGGASGAWGRILYAASALPATFAITIGAPGAAVSGGTGGTGGTSSIVGTGINLTLPGGGGGVIPAASGSGVIGNSPGGLGAIATGWTINGKGEDGGEGLQNWFSAARSMGGRGASSHWSGGVHEQFTSGFAGTNAQGFGTGGGGAANAQANAARTGGTAGASAFRIREYY